MKAPVILSWILALILCFWAGSLVFALWFSQAHCHHHAQQPHCDKYYAERCVYNGTPDVGVRDCFSSRNSCCCYQNNKENDDMPWGSISDWVMVFTTIALFVLGLYQRSTSEKQKAINALQLEIQKTDQRAWVGVKGVRMAVMEVGKPLKISVDIFNSGKTPAKDCIFWPTVFMSGEFINNPAVLQQILGDGWETKIAFRLALFPNADRSLQLDLFEQGITPEQLADVRANKIKVYAIGVSQYRDIFDGTPKRTTTYFAHYDGPSGQFLYMPTHNDAT